MKIEIPVYLLTAGLFLLSRDKEDEDRIPDINYNPEIIPSNFIGNVTNLYFPLIPGTVYTYTAQVEDRSEVVVLISRVTN